jgi:signal transduction histidine kinase
MQKRNIIKLLQLIYDSGRRASELVANMLSFSRKGDSKFKQADLSDIMDTTLKLVKNDYDMKKNYDFKKIKIIREYEENLPKVYCEETKIQQVFINILKNGAEAMHEKNQKTDTPCFFIRIKSKKSWIRVELENNGPPIPYEKRKRIFEPFFTTKDIGKGTGLGLSISYFIITKNHHGTLWVDSGKNQNPRFVIELPLLKDS